MLLQNFNILLFQSKNVTVEFEYDFISELECYSVNAEFKYDVISDLECYNVTE